MDVFLKETFPYLVLKRPLLFFITVLIFVFLEQVGLDDMVL